MLITNKICLEALIEKCYQYYDSNDEFSYCIYCDQRDYHDHLDTCEVLLAKDLLNVK